MRNMPGFAAGARSCTINSPLDFAGRGDNIVYATTVVKWFQGTINWYTFEGLWSLADLPSLPASALVASYEYPRAAANWVPDQGAAAPHANLWHINGESRAHARAPPRHLTGGGRRSPRAALAAAVATRWQRAGSAKRGRTWPTSESVTSFVGCQQWRPR